MKKTEMSLIAAILFLAQTTSVIAGPRVVHIGADGVVNAGSTKTPTSNDFPQVGEYEAIDGGPGFRTTGPDRIWLEITNRVTFEAFLHNGPNCRDRHTVIGQNSFEITMTCDTPERDFRNIPTKIYGTYSSTYLRKTELLRVFGRDIRRTVDFKLVKPAHPDDEIGKSLPRGAPLPSPPKMFPPSAAPISQH